MLKTLLIQNNKKREAALKNEAGGDEKHLLFFLLGLKRSARQKCNGHCLVSNNIIFGLKAT